MLMLTIWKLLRQHWQLCFILLGSAIAAWEIPSFGSCYFGYHDNPNHNYSYKDGAIPWICFLRGPVSASNRLWHFVTHHSEAIAAGVTAVATIAIAWFTGTIWIINRSQLRHGREVERAYVSGGGWRHWDRRISEDNPGEVTLSNAGV
jgi:hypothetical protein